MHNYLKMLTSMYIYNLYFFHEKLKCHVHTQSHYLPQRQLLLTIDVWILQTFSKFMACVRTCVCGIYFYISEMRTHAYVYASFYSLVFFTQH